MAAQLYTPFYVFLIDATVFVAAPQSIFSRQLHISCWTKEYLLPAFKWIQTLLRVFHVFLKLSRDQIYPEMCKLDSGFRPFSTPLANTNTNTSTNTPLDNTQIFSTCPQGGLALK